MHGGLLRLSRAGRWDASKLGQISPLLMEGDIMSQASRSGDLAPRPNTGHSQTPACRCRLTRVTPACRASAVPAHQPIAPTRRAPDAGTWGHDPIGAPRAPSGDSTRAYSPSTRRSCSRATALESALESRPRCGLSPQQAGLAARRDGVSAEADRVTANSGSVDRFHNPT